MKDSMIEYKEYMKIKNYSETTIDLYLRTLKDYKEFLEVYDNLTPEEATKKDVLQYLYYLNEKGNGSRTRNRKYYTLKSFYKWYCRKYMKVNPTYAINSIKIAERLPRYLNLQQALQVQNIFTERNTMYYKKFNMIIKLFLNTGLRVSEVCNIKLSDIDIPNCSINVKCKGNKYRTTYFTTKLKKELEIYCDEFKPYVYLFESRRGKNYTRRGIYEIVQNAYKLAKIKGMTVHSLRHTVATLLYENTKDILVVKEFLGHASIESTEIYTHVCIDEVREAVNRNPLNR